MSDEERIEQTHAFKRIQKVGFRITLLQVGTLALAIFGAFQWYINWDEKKVIDGSTLIIKIADLSKDVKNTHDRDLLIAKQQRYIDSVAQDKRFSDFSTSINEDITKKIITTNNRLDLLERRVRFSFVEEIKKHGAAGPVTVKPTTNK